MNISAVSKATEVSADTIRYYERIGLIPPVKRNNSGVRVFTEEDVKWLTFSRQMRRAGMSIEALIEYLTLFREGQETVPARIDLLKEQEQVLQEKVELMQEALERLRFKIDNYGSHMIPREQSLKDFD
ncbi:MerR family transcriptional regulator [Vagococcus sp. BWB3-3]|uniref:MerR family transcriptional regulator n=1 Tax=Vagococcus allomyrinae TaxID=2794353 RepID=A0A940SU55_9ENTE|nr:MerR family transcriptional regulator [Vagococcus allomyrinae]MBP1039731.1 MerR family transcriptional regulator [Vagococcus allomyrinae]